MDLSPRSIDPELFDMKTAASDDFFQHVNGGWLDANPVPPEYGSWGAFHEVNERNQELLRQLMEEAAGGDSANGTPARMVGDYFAAAMDEAGAASAGAAPLASLLARIDSAGSVADVRGINQDLQRMGIDSLHGLGVAPDFENADAYLVYVGQGGLGLPERDYYMRDDEASTALRSAYASHVANQLGNLGDSDDAARDAAGRILAFETRLAEASYTAEKMRDVKLTMNRHAVSELDSLMPQFGLRSYVAELGVTSTSVCIDNPGFFSVLETTLAETPIPTLRDYLRWTLVRAFASSLAPAFENEAFDFYGKTLGGQQKMKPRWKRVIEVAGADIGELVSQLYIAAAFSESAKRRCEGMVDHLLSAMGAAIRGAEWMTEATTTQALEKLAGFNYKIGFPDEWRDYSGLVIEPTGFAENRMRCARFEYDREMGRLSEPVDRTEWAMSAHSINAYYHPLLNEIVFPAGILQPPFFYPDADDAVNYGAIGAVIGHEITHGFDDRGSHFDAKGALREWWTEADRAEFDRRAQVLVEQFGTFEVADDLHVNGRLTLGENIADLGGLSIALSALHEAGGDTAPPIDGFSPQQRFFVSWATVWRTNYTDEYARLLVNIDPHSPARFRVNGPLTNLPTFAAAFAVSGGSPMAQPAEKRAHIW
jgi:putative endopeptidase